MNTDARNDSTSGACSAASSRQAGLYHAFGFAGGGFQLGPGVGDVMAELIAQGRSSTPIDAFRIDRFSDTACST